MRLLEEFTSMTCPVFLWDGAGLLGNPKSYGSQNCPPVWFQGRVAKREGACDLGGEGEQQLLCFQGYC